MRNKHKYLDAIYFFDKKADDLKYQILLAALCLGILVGITIFAQPEMRATGAATLNCYVENALCDCNATECVCGNQTIPVEQCRKA